MKEKAFRAAQFLSSVRLNCRILNKDNLPLMGVENDSIREAIQCISDFVSIAEIPVKLDEKLVNKTEVPQ